MCWCLCLSGGPFLDFPVRLRCGKTSACTLVRGPGWLRCSGSDSGGHSILFCSKQRRQPFAALPAQLALTRVSTAKTLGVWGLRGAQLGPSGVKPPRASCSLSLTGGNSRREDLPRRGSGAEVQGKRHCVRTQARGGAFRAGERRWGLRARPTLCRAEGPWTSSQGAVPAPAPGKGQQCGL